MTDNTEEKPITESVINRKMLSLSSAALRRIADRAETIIRGRMEDGVFD
jgi:hypothetical protein